MTDLDNFILAVVNDGPIKGVDLALEVASKVRDITPDDVHQSIDRLIKEHKILEVEYVLPSMDYRAKSLYFPQGTQIRVLS
jgi:hypothetical protein